MNGHYVDGKKERRVVQFGEVSSAYENIVARDYGSSGGIDSEGKEIKFWIPKKCAIMFNPDVMYITAHVPREDMQNFKIPTTTRNETFSGASEDEDEVIPVPVVDIAIPIAVQVDPIPTAVAVQVVEDCDMDTPISQSKPVESQSSPSNEFYDEPKLKYEIIQKVMKNQKIENIYVTHEIYANLKKGGLTYDYIITLYETVGQTVKLQTKMGYTPKSYKVRGLVKIDTISW